MSGKINILFLGGAKRVSIAECFMEAGKKLGMEVCLFSYELDPIVPIASIGKIIIGLRWDDKDILNHLAETIQKNNIHIVLPFVDGATIVAARLKNEMENIFIPVSPEVTCNMMFDKIKSNEWFKQNRIPVPDNHKEFPLIAKPRKGSASKGLVFIHTLKEWECFRQNFNETEFLIQRYLIADEYTVDAYVTKERNVLSIVPRKRMEVTSGEVTKSITVKDEEIINLSKYIISLLHFEGPITLQFLRENKTGKLYIMEVNPRYGGGVIASIKAGADSCLMLLNEYLKMPLPNVINWEENLIMTRSFREFFYHANNN